MQVYAWILFYLACASVVTAFVQLTILSGMRIIVHELSSLRAWAQIVGPSILLLGVETLAVISSDKTVVLLFSMLGTCALVLVIAFQFAIGWKIAKTRRQWDQDNLKRPGAKQYTH